MCEKQKKEAKAINIQGDFTLKKIFPELVNLVRKGTREGVGPAGNPTLGSIRSHPRSLKETGISVSKERFGTCKRPNDWVIIKVSSN